MKLWVAFALTALCSCSKVSDRFDERKFDLVCDGSTTTNLNTQHTMQTQKAHNVYRIDLANKRYCADDCAVTTELTSVKPNEISRENKEGDSDESLSFQRETGAWSYTWSTSDSYLTENGFCEKRRFSGFPTVKF